MQKQIQKEEPTPPVPSLAVPSSTSVPIEEVIQEIHEASTEGLSHIDASEHSFSPKAFDALKIYIATYIEDLVKESIKESKRNQTDTVSRSHVDRASQYLVTGSGKRNAKIAGTFGGILFGAGVGQLLALGTATPVFPLIPTIIAVLLTICGAILVGYHLAKD
jgi:hypothetical protein